MSKQAASPYFMACIPHAIEPDWDNVWAPRLAGFPVNIIYAARMEGIALTRATYVFDLTTFVADEQSRQMRYRPAVECDFSILVVLHPDGRVDTFKYRGSEMICEASGPDFRTAMIHTTVCGLALDEPSTINIRSGN
jgi:hypothetical protein